MKENIQVLLEDIVYEINTELEDITNDIFNKPFKESTELKRVLVNKDIIKIAMNSTDLINFINTIENEINIISMTVIEKINNFINTVAQDLTKVTDYNEFIISFKRDSSIVFQQLKNQIDTNKLLIELKLENLKNIVYIEENIFEEYKKNIINSKFKLYNDFLQKSFNIISNIIYEHINYQQEYNNLDTVCAVINAKLVAQFDGIFESNKRQLLNDLEILNTTILNKMKNFNLFVSEEEEIIFKNNLNYNIEKSLLLFSDNYKDITDFTYSITDEDLIYIYDSADLENTIAVLSEDFINSFEIQNKNNVSSPSVYNTNQLNDFKYNESNYNLNEEIDNKIDLENTITKKIVITVYLKELETTLNNYVEKLLTEISEFRNIFLLIGSEAYSSFNEIENLEYNSVIKYINKQI